MKDIDELDALHTAATAGPGRMVFAVRAYEEWPAFSARLRAAEAEVERLRQHYDAAAPEHNLLALLDLYEGRRLEAVVEVERLRGALRGMLATHDQSHSEECNAWASRDEDVCTCDDGCSEPHCDCGSLDARNAARAALGEPCSLRAARRAETRGRPPENATPRAARRARRECATRPPRGTDAR